jgi:hypothetical protein
VTAPAGSVVTINGAPMNELELSRIEVDPGTFTFELRSPGRQAVRATITVKDGDRRTIPLRLPDPTPPAPRFVVRDPGASQRRRAYVIGGAGLLLHAGLLGVGIAGHVITRDTENRDIDQGWKTGLRYGGTAAFVVGTAAIAYAVHVYRKAPAKERVLAPVVAPHQLGVALGGSF